MPESSHLAPSVQLQWPNFQPAAHASLLRCFLFPLMSTVLTGLSAGKLAFLPPTAVVNQRLAGRGVEIPQVPHSREDNSEVWDLPWVSPAGFVPSHPQCWQDRAPSLAAFPSLSHYSLLPGFSSPPTQTLMLVPELAFGQTHTETVKKEGCML